MSSLNKSQGTFKSKNGVNDIAYYVYKPEGEIKGIIQISHGMCEYIERYEGDIEPFLNAGYLVCGNDHLGHKGSVKSDDDLGYMGPKDGWIHMYEDVHEMTNVIKGQYPGLPVFLLGHSMGSFIARAVIRNYGNEYAGAIISGTAGGNPQAKMGLNMVKLLKKLRGDRYRSKMLTNLSFGSYNKRYKDVRTDYDWLTRDPEVVDVYMKDKYDMFTFTTSGYECLMNVLMYVTCDEWYDSVPASLPLILVSGADDPVGGWGDGIKEVDSKLKAKDRKDYSCKLYDGMRHELFHEIGKEEVYSDILAFLDRQF